MRGIQPLHHESRQRSALILTVASVGGLLAFLYPFVLPGIAQVTDDSTAHAGAAPLLFAAVTTVSLLATLVTISDDQAGVGRSKTVALLGVLVAIDATLRLVPSIGGASPVFLLIMLVGAVFGPLMGFQMGALTLLMSGFITGGLGPWLPFQMLASGWIGMTAGWLPKPASERARIAILALFGAVWGLLFGALMNIWFWPFTAPGAGTDASLYWTPDLSLAETVTRYARFYLVTSLPFDALRALGNVVLIVVLGRPMIRLLDRYRARFSWEPWEDIEVAGRGDRVRHDASAPGSSAPVH